MAQGLVHGTTTRARGLVGQVPFEAWHNRPGGPYRGPGDCVIVTTHPPTSISTQHHPHLPPPSPPPCCQQRVQFACAWPGTPLHTLTHPHTHTHTRHLHTLTPPHTHTRIGPGIDELSRGWWSGAIQAATSREFGPGEKYSSVCEREKKGLRTWRQSCRRGGGGLELLDAV